EIARLAPEPKAGAVRPLEDRLDPDAVGGSGLRLLDAVAGNVRGVVEAREERGVGRDEDFDLAHVRLAPRPLEGLVGRPREVVDADHVRARRRADFMSAPEAKGAWGTPGVPHVMSCSLAGGRTSRPPR